jgi:hypothetical protein
MYDEDHLCGLVVRVSAYRSRGLGCVEEGPLSLMSITQELFERHSRGPRGLLLYQQKLALTVPTSGSRLGVTLT